MTDDNSGRVWELQVPWWSKGYATLLSLWRTEEEASRACCAECSGSLSVQDSPLPLCEWEPGKTAIGDFVFSQRHLIARRSVAELLAQRFGGFQIRSIEFHDHPALHASSGRRETRIWLPYGGPELCEIMIDKECSLLPVSTATVEAACQTCGRVTFEDFHGIETMGHDFHTPRDPAGGLFFDADEVGEDVFFRPRFSGFNLCTEGPARFIRDMGWTNANLLEVGSLVA